MTQTTARIKQAGKPFEIVVDMERALKYKKGETTIVDFLETDQIFTDAKKGLKAPEKDIMEAFGTKDANIIAGKIVKSGEVLTTQEHRDEEKEKREKQVIDFLVRNAADPQTGRPHTAERIKNALGQAHINLKNGPIEGQIAEIIEKISAILPIKLETKRIKIVIPAVYTGRAYGVVSQHKQSENWLNNGDLEIVVEVPVGILMDFYDKLNAVTHGASTTEEIKDK